MAEQDLPQIYVITPPEFELSTYPDQLAKVLDSHEIACVRVALATRDEDRLSRAADAIREVCYPRAIALVMSEPGLLAQRAGAAGGRAPPPRRVRGGRGNRGSAGGGARPAGRSRRSALRRTRCAVSAGSPVCSYSTTELPSLALRSSWSSPASSCFFLNTVLARVSTLRSAETL